MENGRVKQDSKNVILYRNRYIRRLVGSGWAAECYIVAFRNDTEFMRITSRAQIWYGSLPVLFKQIAHDDKFFGARRFLI